MKQKAAVRKIEDTMAPPAPQPSKKDPKNIWQDFKELPLDEKIDLFQALKSDVIQAFEVAFKTNEERQCYLKDAYAKLIKS